MNRFFFSEKDVKENETGCKIINLFGNTILTCLPLLSIWVWS